MLFDLVRNYSAMINRLKVRWLALGVFGLSLIVTLIFWAIMPASLFDTGSTDYSCCYSVIARDLVAGRGIDFSISDRGIGYPIVIALVLLVVSPFGISLETAMMTVSLIGMGMISTLVFMLARLVWSAPRAFVAALAWMTFPFGLWLTKQPNSEIPFLVCLYAGLYLVGRGVLIQPKYQSGFFIAGILFGLATLIRPVAIGIGLLVGLAILIVSRAQSIRWRLSAILILLGGNLIAVFPWQMWTYSKTGQLFLISSYGVTSIRDGLTFAIDPKNYRQPLALSVDVIALMQDASAAKDQLHSCPRLFIFSHSKRKSVRKPLLNLGSLKPRVVGMARTVNALSS